MPLSNVARIARLKAEAEKARVAQQALDDPDHRRDGRDTARQGLDQPVLGGTDQRLGHPPGAAEGVEGQHVSAAVTAATAPPQNPKTEAARVDEPPHRAATAVQPEPPGSPCVPDVHPDLKGLYARICSDVRWPAPLPRPEDVRLCWNHRFETTSGVCYQKGKIIEVNVIYRDPRLSRELEYLMSHEAAHFIWRDHSPAFRAFLRGIGVPKDYILHRGEASPMYRLVQAERAQRQLRLFG
jgi:hypothetical protein